MILALIRQETEFDSSAISGPGAAGLMQLMPSSARKAAQQAGLARSPKATLLIQGDDRIGLSDALYRAIADAGLNIDFLVAQSVGAHFSVVVGFATESDSDRAAKLIDDFAREWERSGGPDGEPN